MPVSRVFLDWTRPLCETVPDWLLADACGLTDLRDTLIVVPTRQSGWRLRGALPVAAATRGAALLSPAVVSAPVLLTPPPADPRVASELHSLLAWCTVLKAVPPDECAAFLGPRQGEAASTGWALQTARRLQALRQELADGALTIADVAARGSQLVESDRWAAMAELDARYGAQLAAWGLQDALGAALTYAREGRPPDGLRHVVLACVPDPPRLLLLLVERWAALGLQGTVLTAGPNAPDAAADLFDAWGCPLLEGWQRREIDLADADLHLLATPEDQARCVADLIDRAKQAAPPAPAPAGPLIAIGAPDGETIAPLQRELESRGLTVFNPQNRPFEDTRLFRLLRTLLEFRKRGGYAETAALFRHPDVSASFGQTAALLRELDACQAGCLPVTLDDLAARARHPPLTQAVRQALAWRQTLRCGSLGAALRVVLQEIYAQRQLTVGDPDDEVFRQSVECLDAALRELDETAAAGYAGDEAADALLTRLQGASLKPERQDEDLDLEGWLELAWNPAPLLFVTGMNEGLVPDGRIADVFLPDTLRRELALRDDRQRLARDGYLLATLVAQRRQGGRVILLAGRTSLAGDPLRPSRLLFRCPDERLVARVAALYRDVPPSRNASAFTTSFKLKPALIATADRRSLSRLSPTAFRDYLRCPLRFYLKRVLGMEPLDDLAREPDALAFGNLIHDVLRDMARSADRPWACGDAGQLAQWLETALVRRVAGQYGPQPWLGVVLAREAAVGRLRAFALRQVAWHAQGWMIEAGGGEVDKSCEIGGARIEGRIDRIDRHPSGRLCVLDYKTSEKADPPEATHLRPARSEEPLEEAVVPAALAQAKRDRRWIDLQLPLYREMVRGATGLDVSVGYVCLGAAQGDTGFKLWDDYSDDLHARAMTCAAAVVRRIGDGIFWPPGDGRDDDEFGELLLGDPEATMEPPGMPR
jgi:ATP-dependent helicase/nuclease subunit B